MASGSESGDPRYAEGYVTPNPSTPKTIGTLNIVFGSALLLCGGCYGFYTVLMSQMAPAMGQAVQTQVETERRKELEKLQEQEDKAETDEDRQDLRAKRLKLEAEPLPNADFAKMYGLSDPLIVSYYMTDALSGIVLNLAMIIAGVGLVSLKEWSRLGAIWVATLKIVRLVTVYGFYIAVVVPLQSKMMGEAFQEIMKAAPQGQRAPRPPMVDMATMYGTMLTGSAVAVIVAGLIYPALSIWLLTRPSAKAACNPPRPEQMG